MPRKRKGVRIVIVAEDERLRIFARKTLEAFGFHRREIYERVDHPKEGAGSGKQYAEKKSVEEYKAYRSKSSRGENVALILATDADEQTVPDRAKKLDQQLSASGLQRNANDAVPYWIPKWHVETWGLYLTVDQNVNEYTQYKRREKEIDWGQTGKGFVSEYRQFKQQPSLTTLSSLRIAYGETQRLSV